MIKWTYSIYLFCIFIVVGCASTNSSNKIAFTKDVRNILESKNIDLTKLQYYIDGDVLLTREITSDTAKITNGKVVFENGKYYNTITLKRNTPGVCTAVYPNRLQVSFEDNNNKYLTFSPTNTSAYQIINNAITQSNTILYDGVPYNIKFLGAAPYLNIAKSVLSNSSSSSRTMKGRRVN